MRDEAPCALIPGVGTLDDPALGLNDEATRDGFGPQGLLPILPSAGAPAAGVADDFDAEGGRGFLDGLRTLAAVGGSGVKLLEPRHLGHGLGDHGRGGVAILNGRRGDSHRPQQPQGVDPERALALLDLLAGIEAAHAALGRTSRALRVDEGRRRLGVATDAIAPLLAQPIVHGFESTGQRPAAEGLVDPAPGRKALGQQAPRAARAHDVAAGIDQALARVLGRPAASAWALEQIGHQGPLGLGEIGVQAAGPLLSAVGIGVAHPQRLTALHRRALADLAHGPESGDARLAKRGAHRRRAHHGTTAALQLTRHLVQRGARLLLRDRPQDLQVIRVERRFAPRRVRVPNRAQLEWRPCDLESLLAEGHRARIVWGLVEGQDLSALYEGIKAVEGGAGRAAIAPEILYALWLYATLKGIGSARKLARLTREHDA